MVNVLLVGESWVSISTHYKGFNHFVSGVYETDLEWFRKAMDEYDVKITHMPSHLAANTFPFKLKNLEEYQCIILSDVGADTFLLHPLTWLHGERTPNRLETIKNFVADGGGLIMAGGYMSFQGINGAAMYRRSPLAEVLPVKLIVGDDRCERPEGIMPLVVKEHPLLEGLPERWPYLLGYNLVIPKEKAETLVMVGEDPLLVLGDFHKGRCIAYTTDIGPHWCPREFADWEGYGLIWNNMINWVVG
jgi:uncharacterized membrane protein